MVEIQTCPSPIFMSQMSSREIAEYVSSENPKMVQGSSTYIMAIRVVEFSSGDTNLERFLPKNQHTQRKLLNFENWVNGEVSKSAKF